MNPRHTTKHALGSSLLLLVILSSTNLTSTPVVAQVAPPPPTVISTNPVPGAPQQPDAGLPGAGLPGAGFPGTGPFPPSPPETPFASQPLASEGPFITGDSSSAEGARQAAEQVGDQASRDQVPAQGGFGFASGLGAPAFGDNETRYDSLLRELSRYTSDQEGGQNADPPQFEGVDPSPWIESGNEEWRRNSPPPAPPERP